MTKRVSMRDFEHMRPDVSTTADMSFYLCSLHRRESFRTRKSNRLDIHSAIHTLLR